MWVQFIYATFVSNLLITISKYYTYGIGGTWGTFDPRNAREPWDFFKQLYLKRPRQIIFFAGKSPKSPRIHTRKIYKSLLVNVSSECFSNKSASLSELYSNRIYQNAVSLLACADTISFLTLWIFTLVSNCLFTFLSVGLIDSWNAFV